MTLSSEKFWDKHAAKYDDKMVKGPNYAKRLERVGDWAGQSGILLDVGCASGEITLDMAGCVGQVHGIDHSPKMIELARAKVAERGVDNIQFSCVEPGDESLARESFDAITVFSVFHLVDDVGGMLSRLHELLKPGGVLITETPCIGSWNPFWWGFVKVAMLLGIAPSVQMIKVSDLESMITAAGFEVVESKVYNPKSRMQCVMARKG